MTPSLLENEQQEVHETLAGPQVSVAFEYDSLGNKVQKHLECEENVADKLKIESNKVILEVLRMGILFESVVIVIETVCHQI